MLHLDSNRRRPQPNLLSDKEYQVQTEEWAANARSIARALPSVDFVGWHGEHYVVVRSGGGEPEQQHRGNGEKVDLKELPARRRLDCAKGVDFGGEDAAWMERKDLPMDYDVVLEIDFPDGATRDACFAAIGEPQTLAMIVEDEEKLFDRSRIRTYSVCESVSKMAPLSCAR